MFICHNYKYEKKGQTAPVFEILKRINNNNLF